MVERSTGSKAQKYPNPERIPEKRSGSAILDIRDDAYKQRFWHPSRMQISRSFVNRWCRCAQPPPNGFSPSRTQKIRILPVKNRYPRCGNWRESSLASVPGGFGHRSEETKSPTGIVERVIKRQGIPGLARKERHRPPIQNRVRQSLPVI